VRTTTKGKKSETAKCYVSMSNVCLKHDVKCQQHDHTASFMSLLKEIWSYLSIVYVLKRHYYYYTVTIIIFACTFVTCSQ